MSLRSLAVWAACAALLAAPCARAQGEGRAGVEGEGMSVRSRVRAPEFDGARGWLNTDAPLSLAQLRGKIVLLDFWTYGCINCVHVIPDLKRLEEKYAKELVVIGVHSAKFENERENENIRRIILRYEIEHPVVNDADFKIWQAYAVRAWPTFVVIDPAGYLVPLGADARFGGTNAPPSYSVAGEGQYEVLDEAVGRTAAEFRKRGALNEQPLKLALERARTADLPLAFPGKVLADEKTDRLFVADSNHNRVVVTRLDGTLVGVIGTGARGSADGAFETATFYRPQGLALDGDSLYVADTSNHLIRRVDLKTRQVSTVAGTGQQGRWLVPGDGASDARKTPLSSPWDLRLVGRTLYVAMAGPHQIWQLDLDTRRVSLFAGSGREARQDGPRLEAGFAQPSGLASEGPTLYVADSESNIIRAIDLTEAARAGAGASSPQVRTLAGGDLFEFGDADGAGDSVRLQHPLGVVAVGGAVFVADTYNHKIKRLDPARGAVKTFAGTGRPGQADGAKPSFYEPGGLSHANGRLYVADTNNHAVRVLEIATGRASTLRINGLKAPTTADAPPEVAETLPARAEEIKLAPQRLAVGASNALVVEVALPAGHHLNENAPHRVRATVERGGLALEGGKATLSRASKDLRLPLRLAVEARAGGPAEIRLQLTVFYCREDNTGTCRVQTLAWSVPVEVSADAAAPREIRARGEVK